MPASQTFKKSGEGRYKSTAAHRDLTSCMRILAF